MPRSLAFFLAIALTASSLTPVFANVEATLATAPVAVSPGLAVGVALIEARCPTFSWGYEGSPERFELVVYRLGRLDRPGDEDPENSALSEVGAPPVLRVTFPGSVDSWTPALGQCLTPGGRYAWSVRAVSGDADPATSGGDVSPGWSAPRLFAVSERPSVAEVEEALALLERYRGSHTPPAQPAKDEPRPNRAPMSGEKAAHVAPDPAAGPAAMATAKRPAPLSAPTLSSSPSLTVDDQIHLGADGQIFKDGKVFLWSDGGGSPPSNRNTALGEAALGNNTTGISNSALGYEALNSNTEGKGNTAVGESALFANATGNYNTAFGLQALGSNTLGDYNTAVGREALASSASGNYNTAVGEAALFGTTSGNYNTAIGHDALMSNTTGSSNVAVGEEALFANSTGDNNIVIGRQAGRYLTTGSNNIAIGHDGVAGSVDTIRIGTASTHTRTFIAGISGATTHVNDAIPVLIDSAGQLGTTSSSRRYKEDIQDMAAVSERLLQLRPVTFRYKKEFADGETPVQFGLIAEEVARVFPELVAYNQEGQPETVKYHLLSSLLLNELKRSNAESRAALEALGKRVVELERLDAATGR